MKKAIIFVLFMGLSLILLAEGTLTLSLKQTKGNHYELQATSVKSVADTTFMEGDTTVSLGSHLVIKKWVADSFYLYGEALKVLSLDTSDIEKIMTLSGDTTSYRYDSVVSTEFYLMKKIHHIRALIKRTREGDIVNLGINSIKQWDEIKLDVLNLLSALFILIAVIISIPIIKSDVGAEQVKENKPVSICAYIEEGTYGKLSFVKNVLGIIAWGIIFLLRMTALAVIIFGFMYQPFYILFQIVLPGLLFLCGYLIYKAIKAYRDDMSEEKG